MRPGRLWRRLRRWCRLRSPDLHSDRDPGRSALSSAPHRGRPAPSRPVPAGRVAACTVSSCSARGWNRRPHGFNRCLAGLRWRNIGDAVGPAVAFWTLAAVWRSTSPGRPTGTLRRFPVGEPATVCMQDWVIRVGPVGGDLVGQRGARVELRGHAGEVTRSVDQGAEPSWPTESGWLSCGERQTPGPVASD